mmetsp:Transcript_3645/g.8475  ORF Transcript_3645/g.8475 Transcript_3645/m.8475 type:complete len:258 (+) Transcript_3645:151-924(+)
MGFPTESISFVPICVTIYLSELFNELTFLQSLRVYILLRKQIIAQTFPECRPHMKDTAVLSARLRSTCVTSRCGFRLMSVSSDCNLRVCSSSAGHRGASSFLGVSMPTREVSTTSCEAVPALVDVVRSEGGGSFAGAGSPFDEAFGTSSGEDSSSDSSSDSDSTTGRDRKQRQHPFFLLFLAFGRGVGSSASSTSGKLAIDGSRRTPATGPGAWGGGSSTFSSKAAAGSGTAGGSRGWPPSSGTPAGTSSTTGAAAI